MRGQLRWQEFPAVGFCFQTEGGRGQTVTFRKAKKTRREREVTGMEGGDRGPSSSSGTGLGSCDVLQGTEWGRKTWFSPGWVSPRYDGQPRA